VESMLLLSFIVIFFGFSYSRPRSDTFPEKYKETTVKNVNIVSKEIVKASDAPSCQPTFFANSTPAGPSPSYWGTELLFVSELEFGTSFTSLAFDTVRNPTPNSSHPSMVDFVIYNSSRINNVPGGLIIKLSNINLASFPLNTFNCLSLPYSLSPGYYWVGFFSYPVSGTAELAYGKNVGKSNSRYIYSGKGSPAVGSLFPYADSSDSGNQVVIGSVAPQNCPSLLCGQCTTIPDCVWCLTSSSCIGTQQMPQCPSWTRKSSACRDPCDSFSSCDKCVPVNSCAWCEIDNKPSECRNRKYISTCSAAVTEPAYCNA